MKKNLDAKERAYVERGRVRHVASVGRNGDQYRSLEIDYAVALRVDGVVASWGFKSSR